MARDVGIDLGTSSVLICVRGKGIILEEPSVVALDRETGRVKKIGREAEAMIGRTPPHIETIRPMRDGVISQYDMTLEMLQYFIARAGGAVLYKPRMVICVPCGITDVEERALMDASIQAGASKTYLIEEPIAAARGAGLDIDAPHGVFLVDIGGGTTDIAILSMGDIILSDSVKVGGDKCDDAIERYLRRKYNLAIGQRSAENVKKRVGSAWAGEPEKSMEVRGRCLMEGLPKAVTVTNHEITEALEEPLGQILDAVCGIVEQIPTELLGDIAQNGIVLTGGGALLSGMDKRVAKVTGLPCHLAADPLHCVAIGTGMALSRLDEMQEGTRRSVHKRKK